MARPREPELPPDIPSWLMTFSDVITLLMTFFILLLTFATSEPERFERMQISMFGGAGANGIVGPTNENSDHDSFLVRARPRSARLTTRGAEMAPIHSDPAYESLANGIDGLEQNEQRELSTAHAVEISLALMFNSGEQLTELGQQQLKMIAQQMNKQPLELTILYDTPRDQKLALRMALSLAERFGLRPGRIGVGQRPTARPRGGRAFLVLTLPLEYGDYGS